ncbi:hypothetical protein ACTHQ8_04175 [Lysinibacillus odysseyi]|uniref:Uncharacterized protein n=1 Tax=Lysinibacillus odysseyi 34hs-1 = NBRC 100172 TaxID=1220589 RepID=A0A0A3IAX6_9BACI|nr:hypothetical protein [Lysinibacillus odysseyi]KGR81854.1 hypothetical protein CD32_21290 [Lysinibacillus odysseyi 34hs-1 = NBRC 100172]
MNESFFERLLLQQQAQLILLIFVFLGKLFTFSESIKLHLGITSSQTWLKITSSILNSLTFLTLFPSPFIRFFKGDKLGIKRFYLLPYSFTLEPIKVHIKKYLELFFDDHYFPAKE